MYVADTAICDNAVEISKNADILICESTLAEDMADKAEISRHLTSSQAAEIAKQAKVKKLVLTHFSPRYKSVAHMKEEAKRYSREFHAQKIS